jgi:hypothetical protein
VSLSPLQKFLHTIFNRRCELFRHSLWFRGQERTNSYLSIISLRNFPSINEFAKWTIEVNLRVTLIRVLVFGIVHVPPLKKRVRIINRGLQSMVSPFQLLATRVGSLWWVTSGSTLLASTSSLLIDLKAIMVWH